MNIIQLENVNKSFKIPHEKRNTLAENFIGILSNKKIIYEELKTLQNINLEVKKGEFLGIIGNNGSGKSTLLKIVAGVLKPDSGKVFVNGKISPFLELGVGFNGELTAKENIYLYGIILGLSRREIDTKIPEIIKFAELEKFIDAKVKNFSSGMYVRLAFATAIQVDSPILLLDEVLAVGDQNFQEKCYEVFKKFKKEGKTVLFVSHDSVSVEKWCDRCILLDSGKIKKEGNCREVLEYYRFGNSKEQLKEIKEPNIEKNNKIKDFNIIEFKVLDEFGNPKNIFNNDEKITFEFKIKAANETEELNLGVQIHTEKGIELLGFENDMLNTKINLKKGENKIKYIVNKLEIFSGNVFITYALYKNKENDFQCYDFSLNENSLIIKSKNNFRGIVSPKVTLLINFR